MIKFPKFYMLCGLPASGKSHYALDLQRIMSNETNEKLSLFRPTILEKSYMETKIFKEIQKRFLILYMNAFYKV